MAATMDEPFQEAFASLYAEHASFMRRTLMRRGVRAADLDDVAQEAFAAAHRSLPAFEGRSSLRTWLTAIAWRTAAHYHKRSQQHHALDLDHAQQLTDLRAGSAFEPDELPAACEALEPELRDLILLHDVGGLNISELSSLTGRARATIRQRLEQGRALVARGSAVRSRATEQGPSYAQLASVFEASDARPYLQLLPNKQVCFSSIDDVLIQVWRGPTSPEYLKSLGESMEALLALYPGGIRYLCVIEASSKPPGREGRQVNAELARRFGPRVKAASYSLESSTLMRIAAPILNSYLVLARASINIRFFNAVGPATSWLAQHGGPEQAALLSHVSAMRACVDQARRD